MKVTCIGKLNIDLFYKVDNLRVNQNHVSNELKISVGGKATNVSVALSKLGVRSYLIARVGKDEFGTFAFQKLKSFGITPLLNVSEKTGATFIVVDKNGNNTMFNYLGANEELCVDDVAKHKDIISNSHIVFYQAGVDPQILDYIKKINKNIFVELTTPIVPEIIGGVKYVSLNENEAKKVSGERDLEKALSKIISMGVNHIFLKLGNKGSMYYSERNKVFYEAFQINPIDTTGAGDAFSAGIIYALLNKFSIIDSLKFANICGSLTCLKNGTTEAFPTIESVRLFLDKYSKE